MILRKRQIILYLEYQIIFLKKKEGCVIEAEFFFLILSQSNNFIEDKM